LRVSNTPGLRLIGALHRKNHWITGDGAEVSIRKPTGNEVDVDWGTLQRFLDGSRPNTRTETVDKLCEALGLELRARKERARSGRDEREPRLRQD
jgi:hypothetical protein